MQRHLAAATATLITLGCPQTWAFEEYSTFAEYPTRLKEPVIEKGTHAYKFRAALQSCAKRGIDFAGKYSVCSIGQGSNFQLNFLIDRYNGKVYEVEDSEVGYAADPASDLFVTNFDYESYWTYPEIPHWLWVEYYTFDEAKGKMVLIERLKPVADSE